MRRKFRVKFYFLDHKSSLLPHIQNDEQDRKWQRMCLHPRAHGMRGNSRLWLLEEASQM